MRRLGNADAHIRLHLCLHRARTKADGADGAQIASVIVAIDAERDGEFPRTRAEGMRMRDARITMRPPPLRHDLDPARRFDRAKEHKTIVAAAFDEHVEK